MRRCAAAFLAAALLFLASPVYAEPGSDDEDKTADAYFQASDWTNAAKAYEAIAKRDARNGNAWFRLGASLYQLGRDADAISAYMKADEVGVVGFPPAFFKFRIARAYARMKKNDSALEWLSTAIDAGFSQPKPLETMTEFDGLRSDERFKAALLRVNKAAYPCMYSDTYRSFDFWVGEWDVFSGPNLAGTSKIERILHDCVIFENWTSSLGTNGKSFNTFDPDTGKWRQTWVDGTGRQTDYVGEANADGIAFTAVQPNPDGTKTLLKMTFTKLPEGKVRQFGETSTDGGKTWSVSYDLTYVKKSS